MLNKTEEWLGAGLDGEIPERGTTCDNNFFGNEEAHHYTRSEYHQLAKARLNQMKMEAEQKLRDGGVTARWFHDFGLELTVLMSPNDFQFSRDKTSFHDSYGEPSDYDRQPTFYLLSSVFWSVKDYVRLVGTDIELSTQGPTMQTTGQKLILQKACEIERVFPRPINLLPANGVF